MKKLLLVVFCCQWLVVKAEAVSDTTTVHFSGIRFEVPTGVQLVAADVKENENLLILKYTKEKGSRKYIGFWNEGQDPLYHNLGCDVSEFFEEVFSKSTKNKCRHDALVLFRREFVKGWERGVLMRDGTRYFYSSGPKIVNVFFIEGEQKVIHIDSDFLSLDQIVELRTDIEE